LFIDCADRSRRCDRPAPVHLHFSEKGYGAALFHSGPVPKHISPQTQIACQFFIVPEGIQLPGSDEISYFGPNRFFAFIEQFPRQHHSPHTRVNKAKDLEEDAVEALKEYREHRSAGLSYQSCHGTAPLWIRDLAGLNVKVGYFSRGENSNHSSLPEPPNRFFERPQISRNSFFSLIRVHKYDQVTNIRYVSQEVVGHQLYVASHGAED